MSEPTYEYVRGKGWVQVLGRVFTMKCGTVVRMEPRKPNPGEKFSNAGYSSMYVTRDREPRMDSFESLYKKFEYKGLVTFEPNAHQNRENCVWITFVPVV